MSHEMQKKYNNNLVEKNFYLMKNVSVSKQIKVIPYICIGEIKWVQEKVKIEMYLLCHNNDIFAKYTLENRD